MRPNCITDVIDCMCSGGAGKLACGTKKSITILPRDCHWSYYKLQE